MPHMFDQLIDRHDTNSSKWDQVETLFGPGVLPMWVADMDLPCPTPIIDAMRQRLSHPFFGYHYPAESLYDAIIARMKERHGWDIEAEWIVFSPGVINSLHASLSALNLPGDQVILQPPVYYPFFDTIRSTGGQITHNPLRLTNNRYEMDLDHLEQLFINSERFPTSTHRIRSLILCNPHNPVGRVWSRSELKALGTTCLRHNVTLISDDIHCDLLLTEQPHTLIASLSPELANQSITLMAASKTFNTPGLNTSYAIIPNARLRERFTSMKKASGGVNILGLTALEAAYTQCDSYLADLLDYLRENVTVFSEGINDISGMQVIAPEGTYLTWVDMRDLGMDDERLADFMVSEARIATDYGYAFGPGGQGFQRFNLACPRSLVKEAIQRLQRAASRSKHSH